MSRPAPFTSTLRADRAQRAIGLNSVIRLDPPSALFFDAASALRRAWRAAG